jgi:outer membrane protein
LNLQYNNNYYYNYNLKEGYSNTPFSDQIKNNAGEAIGLSLSIPIFNRFQVRNKVKSARLDIQYQQFTLDNTKKTLYKEIQTAYLNATASQEEYRSSAKAVEASQESFKYAEERYEIGKASVFEFNESKTKLIKSLSEQIRAKYDYIFKAKILDFYNGIPITL